MNAERGIEAGRGKHAEPLRDAEIFGGNELYTHRAARHHIELNIQRRERENEQRRCKRRMKRGENFD